MNAPTLAFNWRAISVRCMSKSFLRAGDESFTHSVWLRISTLSV